MKALIRQFPVLGMLTLVSAFTPQLSPLFAQGTAFTYQGRLTDGGPPASGVYDLRCSIYELASGGALIAGPVTNTAVGVTDGLFTTLLDFGSGVFGGDARWLEIAVRTNGSGTFATFPTRQRITPTPFAIYASSAGEANSAAGVAAGAVGTEQLANGAVTAAKLSPSGSMSGQVLMSQGSSVNWSHGTGLALPFDGAVHAAQPGLSVSNSAGVGLRGAGIGAGVQGEAAALGRGVQGFAFMGTGVYGEGTWLFATGVEGASELGKGVWGHSTNDVGVFGHSLNNSGVRGDSGAADGVEGHAYAANKSGVYGVSTHAGGLGVTGRGGQAGVQGSSGSGDGVVGNSSASGKSGVYGYTTSPGGYGVYARNHSGDTWVFLGGLTNGVSAHCGGFFGGLADYGEGAAVYGVHDPHGAPTTFRAGTGSYGLFAQCSQSYQKAALFVGNVEIQNLSYDTVCELGEGLDYAEGFEVREDARSIEPGCVLSIDEDQPGQLRLSREAYDVKVAGIVAGAKGLGSGVRLGGQRFDHPVALAGRVYCNVDAKYGSIQPGSLLTTSPTPGRAMVVKNTRRAQGAILGKAMEALPSGQGQILVLVTLQ